jgi:hypothetical protein
MKLHSSAIIILGVLTGIVPSAAQDSSAHKPIITKHILSVWHWGSKTEPMGINFVVNDADKTAKVLKSYKKNNVSRVYGDYLRMASTPGEKEHLKRWNTKLYNDQIKSFYLIGSPEWIFPEHRNYMLELIKNNYILFNKSAKLSERLRGIHLDIEIHALPEWAGATEDRRREMMRLLKDTYKDVKEILIENGMGTDEVMADIPFWYDSLSAVGWKSDEDRKEWFSDVAKYLNGFSIMDYEDNSVSTILERARWERDNFKGVVEIGINSEEYKTTWKTRTEFRNAIAEIIEKTNGPVAIHRYVFVMKVQERPLVKGD